MAGRFYIGVLLSVLLCGCADFENTGFIYPNTVTANGDEFNEVWCMSYLYTGLPDTLTGLTLNIYDVNNQVVYTAESNSIRTCWEPMPGNIEPGTYYFIVDYYVSTSPGQQKTFWGEFRIVK